MTSARRRRKEEGEQTLDVFWAPLALSLGLVLLSFLPRVQESAILLQSFWAAAIALLLWQAALYLKLSNEGEGRSFEIVLRKPHYIQAMVQIAVFAYWGYYWRPVYDFAWLLVAQLVFAYGFDMLLSWSRRKKYYLGFGPFPIVFSTNLFLWFRDDWFYLQFLMLGVGFLGKEFVKWQREGRKTHIFNPSAFSLGLFSVVLIATGTSELTWGQEIATTLSLAPRIYLFLFGVGLVVMYYFHITLVAGAAAATLFGLSAAYSAWTGVPYFIDSEIPTAVFLGLLLLITDPSTSPRKPLGKLFFGVLYGLGVFGLFSLLGAFGVPTFYDKLLCVPLLNLSVQWIDGGVRTLRETSFWKRWQPDLASTRANLVHMGLWTLFFGTMAVLGRTDGPHPGDRVPFWMQACEEGRPSACERLIQIEYTYCADNSGWACNELGRHYRRGQIVESDEEVARTYFGLACELRFQPGCLNLLEPGSTVAAAPRPLDLRLLLREGGRNLLEAPERELYDRACAHGWSFACEELATS